MKLTHFGLLIWVCGFAQCTSKSDTSMEVRESPILEISCSASAVTSDNVPITVTFQGSNGCAKPYEIKAEKVGQTILLRAYASYPNGPVACTEALTELTLEYSFFADLPGDYFFQDANNTSIGDTLKVY